MKINSREFNTSGVDCNMFVKIGHGGVLVSDFVSEPEGPWFEPHCPPRKLQNKMPKVARKMPKVAFNNAKICEQKLQVFGPSFYISD